MNKTDWYGPPTTDPPPPPPPPPDGPPCVRITEGPNVLTRARYRAAWGKQGRYDRDLADRAFDLFSPRRVEGTPDADYIDPTIVGADLHKIDRDAEELRTHAERTRAHRTPRVDTPEITFHALHKAIFDVQRIIEKYYAMVTLGSVIGHWEPVIPFDTIEPFMRAWVDNRTTVDADMAEGTKT